MFVYAQICLVHDSYDKLGQIINVFWSFLRQFVDKQKQETTLNWCIFIYILIFLYIYNIYTCLYIYIYCVCW